MKCPALVLACGFALGILLARFAHGPVFLWLAICAAFLVAGALGLRSGRFRATAAFALAGFICAGGASARLFRYRFPADHVSHLNEWGMNPERPLLLVGTLAASPLQMPYGIQFDLNLISVSDGRVARAAAGKVRLRVLNGERSPLPAAALQLRYGETIRVWARLRPPQEDRNPGGFNYRRWIESIHDIYWEGIVEEPEAITKLAGRRPPLLPRLIESTRQRLLTSIDRMYPPWTVQGRDGAVLKAVLLGDRSSLDSATVENFRKSGLYHLLVVAGLHVGLLALLAEGLLRLLRLRESWRAALMLLLLVIYASLVEQRAPTLRASLMIGVYLLARLIDRSQPALNAIGIAALVLLFHRPAWLFDSGFELSFAAALLIAGLAVPILARLTEPYRRALWRLSAPEYDIALAPRAAQFRLDLRRLARLVHRYAPGVDAEAALRVFGGAARSFIWIADLVIFSAILQLGLLLPMAVIFHRVTLAGIGLNALAVPLMTILLAVAVPVVFIATFLPSLAMLPGKFLALIMQGLFGLTELPRMPHWLSFRVPAPPAWVEWGFALGVMVAAVALPYSRKLFGAAGACAVAFGLLISLSPFPPAIPSGEFQMTALDCGGGEGLFLVLPDRTTILVGAGGGSRRRPSGGDPFRARRWDPGENIVSPYLWSRRIKTIDVFLLLDSSGDHLSGVASVLRNFRVKEFWYGSPPQEAETLWRLLEEHGVAARPLRAGDAMTRGQTRFKVIWQMPGSARGTTFRHDPAAGSVPRRASQSPLLLRISGPDGSVLLAADLNRAGRAAVLRAHLPIKSTALEVQSTAADSTFAARVQPAVVLETSHPRAADGSGQGSGPSGAKVYSVESRGAVTVAMEGGSISILAER
ncbi:MAG: ComEC/Rec2 family competence protein, partial [Terriglobia bacterium]